MGEPGSLLEPAKKPPFAISDRVYHPQFGNGAVTTIDGGTLTVAFSDHRVRQVLDYYVRPAKNK
jgi:hypothetical protein